MRQNHSNRLASAAGTGHSFLTVPVRPGVRARRLETFHHWNRTCLETLLRPFGTVTTAFAHDRRMSPMKSMQQREVGHAAQGGCTFPNFLGEPAENSGSFGRLIVLCRD